MQIVEDRAVGAGLPDVTIAIVSARIGRAVEHAVAALGDGAGNLIAIVVVEAVHHIEDGTVRADLVDRAVTDRAAIPCGGIEHAVAAYEDASEGIRAIRIAETVQRGETGAIRLDLEDRAVAGGAAAIGRAIDCSVRTLRQIAL